MTWSLLRLAAVTGLGVVQGLYKGCAGRCAVAVHGLRRGRADAPGWCRGCAGAYRGCAGAVQGLYRSCARAAQVQGLRRCSAGAVLTRLGVVQELRRGCAGAVLTCRHVRMSAG